MLKKFISILTVVSFLLTGVCENFTYAVSFVPVQDLSPAQPFIPSSLGKITSSNFFDDNNIVINIQDLHCHSETQKKIASIIEYLDTKYGLDKVYLEGASGNVDTSWLSKFTKDKIGKQVIENLTNSGKLSGTEFYSVMKNKKNFIEGIENAALYRENISLLGEILTLSPEIEAVCNNIEIEIKSVRKDYSSRQARNLQKIISSYDNGKITTKKFYNKLTKFANELNILIDKYKNLSAYISMLNKTANINNGKTAGELAHFLSELKNKLNYKDYSALLKKSNGFSDIVDISYDLIKFNNEFEITKKLKLKNLDELFDCFDINGKINPIMLIKEKEDFIDELYTTLGRTKYEKEVSFLADFVPTIKKYFTAEISADEYYNFENNYNRFKTIWTSYLSEEAIKRLDTYYDLLSTYHRNNILRDSIFANTLMSVPVIASETSSSIASQHRSAVQPHSGVIPHFDAGSRIFNNAKKITLVVTGGFHTRGLERIFKERNISYAIITPTIRESTEQAKLLYTNSILYYSTILKNTINLKPLSQEPLNISFPKVLESVFSLAQGDTLKQFSEKELKYGIKNFIDKYITDQKDIIYGNVEIVDWQIISNGIKNANIEFFVEYKDYGNNGTISRVNYIYSNGEVTSSADIDVERTSAMIDKINNSKFADPSVELEPTTSARKKIYDYIIRPLEEINSKYISLMPYKQLHMTIGYEPSGATRQEMEEATLSGDKSHSIFVAAEKLNESLSIKQTTLKGTLKLMPDGALIYEITDRDLIEQMLSLRSKFRNINPKYNTANIIHITIGRISDKNILKDTPQSKEALADLLKLINNKIYKINKAAALSKIKTSFTIKGGFVSSTGDKDYLTTRFYPANESLVILKDIFKNAGKKINFIYTVIIAPIIEEVVFRVVPFTLTGMSVSNPASFIPALVTIFTGTFLFSAAHPLADKLTYSKDVRNIKNFIVPSLLLTSVYIATSVAFPEYGLFVSLISILLHAANNLVAYIKHIPQGMLNIFNIKESQNPEGNAFVNKWLLYLIQETEDLIKKEKSSSYYSQDEKTIEIYRECKKFFEDISSGNFSRQDDENVEDKLINIMQQLSKWSNNDVGSLLEGILIVSAYLRDSSGGVLFDKLHNFVMKQCTNGSSSRWQEILLWCAEAFYETNREYTYKIIDAFYENKKYIKSLLDYGRFALPLPSPAKFSSVADWENAIYEMMVKDSDIYPNWYSHELEIFIPSDIKKIDDYGKVFLRALYRSKKFTEPPYLRKIEHGYEWQKMFYNICGNDNGIYVFDESEPLIDRKTIKKFPYDPDILNTRNLYLSDIISSLNYLQKEVKPDYLFESSELSQILSALKDARSTSVQNQLKVVNAQINKLAELFIEKEDNISERNIRKTAEVLKLLIPILMFVKSDGSQKTLLNDILVKFKSVVSNFNSKYIADLDSIYSVIEELISIDKQEALDLLKALYANKYAKEFIFGRNWQQWQPVTVQDAYSFIPNKIQELLSYRDLELLYHNAGIDFDFIEEDSSLFDRTIYIPEYEELFLHLPETLSTQKKFPLKYFRTVKKEHLNKSADYDATHTASSVYFDALENILENNTLALSEMNKANRQSIEDSFSFVEEMIKNYSLLNKKNASAVQISLERIKESFYSSQMSVSDMMKLKKWSVNELDKIEELHTLINAIHQSSIENFMDILTIADGENKVIFKCDNVDMLSFFDCSSSGLDRQMQDFISSLSMRFADNSNFVVKDKKLVSSTRLGVHSVDILVDLEEGIRVTFNDSGRGDGNAMRVLLLATLFAQAGFDITNIDTKVENSLFSSENSYRGTCNFSARLSLPSGQLNNAQVYAKYFEQALTILSGTKNLDYTIENNDVDNETHRYFAFDIPQYDLDDFKLLKHTSDMPRGFNDIKTLKKEWEDRIAKIKSIDTQLLQENSSLAEVYDYLQIPQDRRNLWEIVNEYVKGKLVFNEDSVLEPNEQYGGFYPLLRAIKDDADLALKQAQLINLLNYDDLCYETQGYIGGMLVVSGIIRLDNYGWLSVKTAVDKERKRAKFAYVEYVDFRGNTRKIDYYELLQILQSSGYTVKEQKPRSRFEKQDSLRVLKEDIFPPKDGIYTRGLGVSSQTDGYVPVRITYDKNKIDENSMWIVSYTSPEDVAAIIKARAIMTTTGGMLSHANITARENGKVAILSNGEWVQGELEVPYYVAESDVEDINGYLTQKVSERKFILKEGTVALANGAGGRILVYDNISPEIISDLQNAIDNIDIQYIIDCLEKYQKDSNIRQIVEYIFLQVVTDKTKAPITKILLAYGNDTQIGTKVAELSRVYINEKIEVLNSYLENERKIKDAAIRYSVINFIEKELDVLAYFYIDYEQAHDDIQNLINKVMKDNNITISAINKKVTGVIKRLNEILSEDDVSRYDKEELIKICQTAKVWNFYGNAYLRKLVLKADEISDKHDGTDYSTEINKFADISAKDLSKYGSKTTELANIVRLFIKKDIRTAKVPDGIGVSKDVLRIFFEHADKKDEYLRLAADFEQAIKNKDKKQALRIGSQISRLIADSDDGQLKQYLEKELKQGTKYAVRSSGIGEDGQNHAFAGMAETKLNVDSNNVYECVKLCWQSFYSPVCIEDMLKENVVVLPAILIQEMVSDVKKAGVIFSRDNGGDLTIEAVLGLGEGLVSGRITPDHISVKASDGTIRYRRALNGMIKVEENVSGGTKVSKLTRDEKIERILDEQTIKTLNKIAYVLEEDSGYPIDIEFAIDDSGQIFVLQRRAITSLDMKIGEQLPEVSPKIEQSIVVNAVEALSLLDQIVDEAEQVFKNLFNLPEDIDERYSAVVEQIYTIVNLIKKYNRAGYSLQYPLRDDTYGEVSAIQTKLKDFCDRNGLNNFGSFMISDFMICVLAGFVQIKNISSDNLFFYTIIDTLFSDYKGEVRKDINIINDVSMLLKQTYKLNSNFIPYAVRKMLKEGIISKDEDIPYKIESNLKDYDALKQYYFTISEDGEIDKELSLSILNNVKNFREKALYLITDTKDREQVSETLAELEELAENINDINSVLLERLLEDLMSVISRNEHQTDLMILYIPFFADFANVKKKSNGRAATRMVSSFIQALQNSYIVSNDNKNFYKLLDGLVDIVARFYKSDNENIRTLGTELLDGILNAVFVCIYSPISQGGLSKSSDEYKLREQTFYTAFNKISSKISYSKIPFSYLFAEKPARTSAKVSYYDDNNSIFGPGLNAKTLNLYMKFVKKAPDKNIIVPIPKRDTDISDIHQLAKIFAQDCESIDLSMFCNNLIDTGENGRELSLAIIKNLLTLCEDNSISKELKYNVASTLARMASTELYIYYQDKNLFNIDKINELCRINKVPLYLKPVSSSYIILEAGRFSRRDGESLRGQYRFTDLLRYLPKDTLGRIQNVVNEAPVIYSTQGSVETKNEDVSVITAKFNTLRTILDNNSIILSLLDGLSSSKNSDKDFSDIIKILYEMIDGLNLINSAHGNAAKEALDNILKKSNYETGGLTDEMIKQNMELKRWTSDTISEITEIHTLINAIHQQSILDFKETIKNIMEVGNQAIKTIVASHQNPEQNRGYYDTDSSVKTALKLYDLSEDKTNPDILDFIGRLSLLRLPFQKMGSFNEYQIEDFVCKDDFLVWTTRLYAHSVDIFMNFSESEKNIIISYNESSRKRGNAERVRYFETVLKKLGFFVETDTELSLGEQNGVCSLKATLSADYGLNEYTDFVEVATKVVSLFSHSVMLDWDLEAIIDTYSEDYFYESFDKLVKKFEAGDIWYGYAPTSQNSFDKGKLVDLPQRVRLDNTLFRQILQYLQLPVPDFISESSREYLDQPALDKYNNIIERSFAVGRIFIDKDGILKRDEKYNVVSFLAQAISEKEEEFLYNSRLINLLPYNKLNFKTVGYVGDFVAVSGYMKLQNGKYLSVKGLINPATKRMKYSTVELVSVSGRESLSSDKLLQILQEEGFDVSAQEKVSKTEQLKIAETLHKNVQVTDSLETRGTPTSSGNATYVAGRITFNRDKVDKNSILVVPYTTPDDVERIKVAKAILTTGGGVLSHAAITTREYGTPSAIIDGTWKNYGLDILYYLPFGDPLTVDGLSIRTVEEKHKLLKEGSVVLVNGETGHVLLFDDLNENLNSLQNAIDKDDAATISQILSVNTGNKNIGRLIEYVYFQAVGDAQMANTLNMLFSHKSSVVKNKVKELNKNYIHSKILNIEEAMENIKTIEDINIAYSVLGTISDKLNFIKTPEENPDIVLLREKFVKLKEEMDFKYLKYIKELIAKCDALLLQKQFSDSDIAEIVNILQKAKVYNLFVDEKESDIQLQNFMYQLTHKLAVLEIKMRVSLEAKEKKSIVSLDNIQDGDVFSFGSKTTELAKIRRLLKDKENVVVPNGVGISNEVFMLFLETVISKDNLQDLLISFHQVVKERNLNMAQSYANLINMLIDSAVEQAYKNPELINRLDSVIAETLGDVKLSVRSSGVGEDSANNAYAGMGETVLNIKRNNLFDALITCWKSFYSKRSISYMINSQNMVQPAVLVQPMIDVDKSGVVFSRDKYGNCTIETLYGLGEGIVSGSLSPDTITVNMQTGEVLEYSVATKNYKIVSGEERTRRELVTSGAKERTLTNKEIKTLILDVVKDLENDVGYAVDVEFGIKDGKFIILQRRPVKKDSISEQSAINKNFVPINKEIRYNISVVAGHIFSGKDVFVYITNPLNPAEAIPVYMNSRNDKSMELLVDKKYKFLADSGILGSLLLDRINSDPVVLNKLNDGIFNFDFGELGLIQSSPSEVIDIDIFEQENDTNIEFIRSMLSAS